MKKLLLILATLFTFFCTSCKNSNPQTEPDTIKQTAIEYVTEKYTKEYTITVNEDEYPENIESLTIRRFYIDINLEKETHHWCVCIAIEQDGSIWTIDADKWVEKQT